MSPFCNTTVHKKDFKFVDIGAWQRFADKPSQDHAQPGLAEAHPTAAYDFYHSILSYAKAHWNMEMLFLDFICLRGPHLEQALPGHWQASEGWLEGATTAAMELGMEVQYCMACPHQGMASLKWQVSCVQACIGSMDGECIYCTHSVLKCTQMY